MLNARIPALRNQALIGASLFALAVWAAWTIGGKIVAGVLSTLYVPVLLFAACAAAVAILRNWRTGFYLFLVWLLFEDLVRKFMGNGTAFFFGKDILALLVYISLFASIRRGRDKTFRPPFLLWFSPFFFLGALQVFNQNSPSIFYGLLGFKLYFFYFPLIFVGYALIRSDEDLQNFFLVNVVAAGAIATLGIIQAIVGNAFLNPEHLAPELEDLGNLSKSTPLSNQSFSLPDSVFVSSGRFDEYLITAFILVMGAVGYMLLSRGRGRQLVYIAIGLLGGATLLSGSRGAVVLVAASGLALPVGFMWGAPWRWRQAHRLVRAIRRSFIVGALALTAILLIFPEEAGSRMAYYTETLSPTSSTYQLGTRTWDYPVQGLLQSFGRPNWVVGNGIGTASLGSQYVAKLIGQRPPGLWVEEGYGVLIVEMGIIAPFLWILWTAALLYYSWKVVRRLRETRFLPIAVAIFWYAFLLLYPITFGGLSAYQNYSCNAYLWLLVGILFRLPDLLASPFVPVVISAPRAKSRGGLHF